MNDQALASPLGARPRVLFVDDEIRVTTSLRMLCRRHYDVRIANSGAQALEIMRQGPVDVIVSDQRMPEMNGIELLREARSACPNAMRILLTGYADLNAIIGSINEGEIFRFINKPWSNADLMDTLAEAAAAARVSPAQTSSMTSEDAVLQTSAVADQQTPAGASTSVSSSPEAPAVLVVDPDSESVASLRNILGERQRVIGADGFDQAVNILQAESVGVLVSDVRVNGTRVVELLNALKEHAPHLVSIIMTDQADAMEAIELINSSQVYRFLVRPLRPATCRISVRSALDRHESLKKNPEQARRYTTQRIAQPSGVGDQLIDRIRRIRERLRSSPGT